MNLGGWSIGKDENTGETHIVPVNDLKTHMNIECECGVQQDPESGAWVHVSYDGREEYEDDLRKLN